MMYKLTCLFLTHNITKNKIIIFFYDSAIEKKEEEKWTVFTYETDSKLT